jgi:hypothetical protein
VLRGFVETNPGVLRGFVVVSSYSWTTLQGLEELMYWKQKYSWTGKRRKLNYSQ